MDFTLTKDWRHFGAFSYYVLNITNTIFIVIKLPTSTIIFINNSFSFTSVCKRTQFSQYSLLCFLALLVNFTQFAFCFPAKLKWRFCIIDLMDIWNVLQRLWEKSECQILQIANYKKIPQLQSTIMQCEIQVATWATNTITRIML